ncbi:helix-turn-helix domain-containing protein [Kitasatospora sp. NBC_01539]|uniref:helix-turn-helix domain-containing protein n=1 Tax=Kitasatospora sp. NBC_01539 TaxID=2903577 RepID=UPI003860320F
MDNALGDFLRSRRARLRPQDVGLVGYGPRRVPGLRREEVARLAGVSVDYYVRLEQGRRGPAASDSVLGAVARALALDEVERRHLFDLARPPAPRTPAQPAVRPGVRSVLDALGGAPAFVLGRRMQVLAWNAIADALLGFSAVPGGYNAARQIFLDPAARTLFTRWEEEVAADAVAFLRLDAGRHPDDPRLTALIAELSYRSGDFRAMWAAHRVKDKTHGRKHLWHPATGALDFAYESLTLPGDPDVLIVAYTAEPGSRTAQRIALLAELSAPAMAGAGAG